MTFIGTKKIYPLFNIFVVKPNDMYLFGNLHIFKVHLSVQLDMCAAVLSKNHCRMKYCTDVYAKITLSQSECALMSHDLILSVQMIFRACLLKPNVTCRF